MSVDNLENSLDSNNLTPCKNLRPRKISSWSVEHIRNDQRDVDLSNSSSHVTVKSDYGRQSDMKTIPKGSDCNRNQTRSVSNLDDKEFIVNFALPVKKRPYKSQEAKDNNDNKRKRTRSFWMNSYFDIDEIDINFELLEEKTAYKKMAHKTPPKTPLSSSLMDDSSNVASISTSPKKAYKKVYAPREVFVRDQSTETADEYFSSLSPFCRDTDPRPKQKYSSVYSINQKRPTSPSTILDNSPLNVNTPKRNYKKSKNLTEPASLEKVKSGQLVEGNISSSTLPREDSELISKRRNKSLFSKVQKEFTETAEDSPPLRVKTPKNTYSKKTKKHTQPLRVSSGKKKSPGVAEGDSGQGFERSPLPPKRLRGRPRSTARPVFVPLSDEDTTSASSEPPYSQSSSSNSNPPTASEPQARPRSRPRPRTRPWWLEETDDATAPETLSEYELQRQQNIQQNQIKLREIFSENGLEEELFDTNSSSQSQSGSKSTPRKRYSRTPLPPPRPKSQRLENFFTLFKTDGHE